ncbi:MAG: hypothetical protein IBX69_13110 [Anaerolineales bacterium]|nr:hypothetical protein [Anaerolineales bacterium]
MADVKISAATNKEQLISSDMLPLAAVGDNTAYKLTGATLFDSIPAATDTSEGVVELATQAETAAATDTERAVTPASLAGSVGPLMLMAGLLFVGRSTFATLTKAEINTLFNTKFGRSPASGDLITIEDGTDRLHVLTWSVVYGGWFGVQLDTWLADTGRFKSFV